MKSKKFTYLLIVCVTAVWGIIFYRIFASVPDEKILISPNRGLINDFDTDIYTVQDTLTLALNYRDPFLDKEPRLPEEIVTKQTFIQDLLPVKNPQINWDFIKYSGYITNPGTKRKVSIISINGKEQMVEEGEVISGVKLIKNHRDSIKVLYQGKVKFISIK